MTEKEIVKGSWKFESKWHRLIRRRTITFELPDGSKWVFVSGIFKREWRMQSAHMRFNG